MRRGQIVGDVGDIGHGVRDRRRWRWRTRRASDDGDGEARCGVREQCAADGKNRQGEKGKQWVSARSHRPNTTNVGGKTHVDLRRDAFRDDECRLALGEEREHRDLRDPEERARLDGEHAEVEDAVHNGQITVVRALPCRRTDDECRTYEEDEQGEGAAWYVERQITRRDER